VSEAPGLQAERTLLSWERSALGLLVGGALVLIRYHGPPIAGRAVLAVAAGLLALVVVTLTYRRARHMRSGRTELATFEVSVLGYGSALFGIGTAVALALSR
jgi:putative membrane protein